MLRPYYRTYDLPWTVDEEDEGRFRRLWIGLLLACLLLGAIVWLIDVPERPITVETSIPPRLAKLIVEQEPPPPPPPPQPEPERPQPTETTRPADARPAQPTPRPTDLERTQQARQRASQAGLLAFQDDLADLRQEFELTKEQLASTANTTGTVDGPSRAERSVITSKVGQASGGINMAGQSRGVGSGAGNLGGKGTTQVAVPFGGSGSGSGLRGDGVERRGQSGKASRSREEIELVFDRNKGAIYALYSRALREQPALEGKMVLEFTIAPSGEVTMCRVVSSELGDPELERKIVARVRMFRFEPKDVEAITTTKPIDFFPA